MRPPRANIAAPELPPRLRWLNSEPGSMAELTASGPVLVHFFDFAQLNSVRSLPYVREWRRRYASAGLSVLGIHSPRFAFTAAKGALEPALERLEIAYAVAQDSSYAIWNDYGCRGWPSLFLWSGEGALRYFHFGEGSYLATEEAIQEELRALDALAKLPEPIEPLRPTDAPGALVVPPSEELFPGGSPAEPWRAEAASATLTVEYEAGGAYVAVDGSGELHYTLDEAERSLTVDGPGLYELASHPRHEPHGLELRPGEGLAVYGVSFAAGLP
ncbi:MAG: DipZ protein [bacterium]